MSDLLGWLERAGGHGSPEETSEQKLQGWDQSILDDVGVYFPEVGIYCVF